MVPSQKETEDMGYKEGLSSWRLAEDACVFLLSLSPRLLLEKLPLNPSAFFGSDSGAGWAPAAAPGKGALT